MTKIVEYQNKDEEVLYRFRLYAGVDEKTGRQRYIKRSGFHTKKQALDELEKIKYEVKTGQYFHLLTEQRLHLTPQHQTARPKTTPA